MKLGVTHDFCYREDLEADPLDIAHAAQEAVARAFAFLESDRWSGMIVPLEDMQLRQRVFDVYSAAVPPEFQPCREVLHVRDVTIEDIRCHNWVFSLMLFPSPSEDDLENAAQVSYRAEKEQCPTCGRCVLRQGATERISTRLLKKHQGAVELPNQDMFCTRDFATMLAAQGISGLQFVERDGAVREIFLVQQALGSDLEVCPDCGAALLDGFRTVFEHKHTFRHDAQSLSTESGSVYVVSQKLMHVLWKHNRQPYDDLMNIGVIVPLFSQTPLRLLRS
jgi:hypothetical protein